MKMLLSVLLLGSFGLPGCDADDKGVEKAKQEVFRFDRAVRALQIDAGRFCTTAEGLGALLKAPPGMKGWKGPYLKGDAISKDPWGNDYIYVSPGLRNLTSFDVSSAGPDGKPGTADDLGNY